MKEYRKYMDNVSVDEILHNKIMDRITKRPIQRNLALYRYAAVLACVAIVVIGIWSIPHLLHLSDIANPPVDQPKDLLNVKKQYDLYFNRAEGALSQAKKYIPGYFTQDLSQEEIGMLFGNAWQTIGKDYMVNASAGFSGEGVLEGVSVTCKAKTTGLITRIHMANGSVQRDYLYPGEIKLSEVNGTDVTAGYWNYTSADGQTIYYASFVLGQTGYYMEISGDENAKEELTELVGLIIENSTADLSKITPDFIPEWREDELTFSEAQADSNFGVYVPDGVPAGFVFESSRRTVNQNRDELTVRWSSGMKYIDWAITRLKEEDKMRIVNINAPETYDLALYPIPHADSVPEELREIVNNPIFRAEDLTMETVWTRAYKVNDTGDDNNDYRMRFSVLYDNILIKLNAKGVKPDEIYNMLNRVKNVEH